GTDRGIFYTTNVSGQYTFSVWVRLVSGNGNFAFNYYDGADGENTKTAIATGTWQRFSWTFNGTGNADANVALIHTGSQSAAGTFQLWGAQLNPGASPNDYVATTGTPRTVTTPVTTDLVVGSDLTIAVHGPAASANAPPVAVGDHTAVSVLGPTQASGNVLANDSAPSGAPLSVSAVNGQAAGVGATIAGTYGTLTLGANGQYSYSLATGQANVNALAPGQTVTDTFHYTLSDGATHTQTSSVMTGQNLILQSEAFNDPSWVRFAYSGAAPSLTANVAAGPQGGASTADQIVLNGVNKGLYYVTPVKGQNTFSAWVKLVSGDGHFDLNYYDGSASHSQAGVATGTWQRFSFTFNGTGSQYANVAIMHDGSQSGNGTFQIWGAQINPGASPGDYAATAGHYNAVFTNVTTSTPPTADLIVSVSGGDPAAVAPNTLSFAGGTQGVVVNLGAGTWAHALQVMPLGDSITYGWTDLDYQQGQTNTEDGYRGPLWWNFASNSMLIDMVGPNVSGDVYLPDQNHAGYPNYRSDQISALLPGLLAANHPDAILLMAGTNDIFQEVQPAQHVAQSITDMIETVREMSPSTHVYVATLMPINPAKEDQGGDAPMVATVNSAIATAVSQAIAAGNNVSLVDMSAMTLSDISDAAHPTADGYAKLAQIWYNAILAQQPNNGGTPGGTSHAIAAGTNTVIGTEGNDLLIGSGQSDILNGGGGNDRLVSGAGSDQLTGGAGADQFVFSPASGHVTITDFSHAQADHIELDSFAGLTQFSQLAGHISVSGTTTSIDLSSFGSHTVIDLAHFTGSLAASDFWI
ncbi:MAG TPA: GDSL-type esterase/lipase family protein, partial [Rhizomicrobium sp.]|nr:GDSL-type esterase/lipase family protein [Rhizomicrobium sp.]